MKVSEFNGANIFMSWKMKSYIQGDEAELNDSYFVTFTENIHYLFYATCRKIKIH